MTQSTNPNPSAQASLPRERVMRRLEAEGMSASDIAWRFRCSPAHVQRTLRWSRIPRSQRTPRHTGSTPLERTVRKLRDQGSSQVEIAAKLRRSPGFVARVERFARIRRELNEEKDR